MERRLAENDVPDTFRERVFVQLAWDTGLFHDPETRGAVDATTAEREAVMLESLRAEMDNSGWRTLALLYGCQHAPVLEDALVSEFGFRPYVTTWHDAFTFLYTQKRK